MIRKLENKVAVITGGNSGIGLGAAKLFATEGAMVTITGRNTETIKTALAEIGNNARGIVSDVSNINSFIDLYAEVSQAFGKIDILVVNAGIIELAPLEEVTEEMFDKMSNINYKGVFFTVQKALPYLNDGASIIITSSSVADKGISGGAVYTSTKAAERALVRSFAVELAARKIRVNTLSPGSIVTDIFKKNGFAAEQEEGMNSFFESATAMKRRGTVDEIAKGYLFLASGDSSYMTGADLLIDGGFRDL
jgi:NAD(P)-dependent dehydrogenase (short-subunit alcohol dehydrogenase family)